MPNVLCVWEMGEDLGHYSAFIPLLNKLVENNTVYFAVSNLSTIAAFKFDERIKFLQAPHNYFNQIYPNITTYFSDILINHGFSNASLLLPVVAAWRELFALVKPGVIYYDHAPTALLASMDCDSKKIIYSTPFLTLPHGPCVNLRNNFLHNMTEEITVNTINKVIDDLSIKTKHVKYLSDIYKCDTVKIIGFRRLDIYAERRHNNVEYLQVAPLQTGLRALWDDNSTIKVFAYLKNTCSLSESIINYLVSVNNFGYQAIVYCKDHPVLNTQYDMNDVLQEATHIICHGGNGLVTQALGSGIPLAIIPTQLEQTTTAKLIEQRSLGITIDPLLDNHDIPLILSNFFNDFERFTI